MRTAVFLLAYVIESLYKVITPSLFLSPDVSVMLQFSGILHMSLKKIRQACNIWHLVAQFLTQYVCDALLRLAAIKFTNGSNLQSALISHSEAEW